MRAENMADKDFKIFVRNDKERRAWNGGSKKTLSAQQTEIV
jgi:hypothetical protein